ncbi:ubiquinol-cytochrome c reductase iron-sulfur subunit [Marinicella sp. W31]|uniref:ubiquinol-cytochrome c reductase iron-sulfur subunit n=1 Tax=Marinicella sp. W31 TaxID=3023713 RepID=UPI003756B6FB
MTEDVNKSRRSLLMGTAAVGAVGVAFAAVPFIKSWLPSERAKAAGAPVTVDISQLQSGQILNVLWRGSPVFLVNRSTAQTAVLPELNERLKDPESEDSIQPKYADNIHRSMTENLLVVIGICTHLGCSPKYYPDLVPQQFDSEWQGGFYCPCHNSRFDIAGRVFSGSPASRNLDVPPYMFEDDNTVVIGLEEENA